MTSKLITSRFKLANSLGNPTLLFEKVVVGVAFMYHLEINGSYAKKPCREKNCLENLILSPFFQRYWVKYHE